MPDLRGIVIHAASSKMGEVGNIGTQAMTAKELRQQQPIMHGGADLRVAACLAVRLTADHKELTATHGKGRRRQGAHAGQRQIRKQHEVDQRQQ